MISEAVDPGAEDARISQLVEKLNNAYRAAAFSAAYDVGRLVVSYLYDGDIEVWRNGGAGRASYRNLAARSDLLFSPSTLCRAVAVYSLAERLGGVEQWQHLTASHLREVLSLPSASQEAILSMAERERWSVARTRVEVKSLGAEPDYATPARSVLRTVSRLKRQLSEFRRAPCIGGSSVVTNHARQNVAATIAELRAAAAELERMLPPMASTPEENGVHPRPPAKEDSLPFSTPQEERRVAEFVSQLYGVNLTFS